MSTLISVSSTASSKNDSLTLSSMRINEKGPSSDAHDDASHYPMDTSQSSGCPAAPVISRASRPVSSIPVVDAKGQSTKLETDSFSRASDRMALPTSQQDNVGEDEGSPPLPMRPFLHHSSAHLFDGVEVKEKKKDEKSTRYDDNRLLMQNESSQISVKRRSRNTSRRSKTERSNHREIFFSSKETWTGPPRTVFQDSRVRPRYVATSAFCAKNPFRVQSFTDFVMDPIYDAPTDLRDYKAVINPADIDGVRAEYVDSVQAVKAQVKEVSSIPYHQVGKATLEESIIFLCAGNIFFKWPSVLHSDKESFHRRYFWLDAKRCSLTWAVPGLLITFSQLRLRSVMKMTTDCITVRDREIYRMILLGKKVLVFGTPHRILFDQWYAVLRYIISPNSLHGAPGLWQRPSALPIARMGRWESRYSPLYAELLDSKEKEPKLYQSTVWSD